MIYPCKTKLSLQFLWIRNRSKHAVIVNRRACCELADFPRSPLRLFDDHENRRIEHSGHRIESLSRINPGYWDPPPKNLQSSCSPRHKGDLLQKNPDATSLSRRLPYGYILLIRRGKAIASLICSNRQTHDTRRSRPMPNPLWGTLPYLRRSRYHP